MKRIRIRVSLPDGTKINTEITVDDEYRLQDKKSMLHDFSDIFFSDKGYTMDSFGEEGNLGQLTHVCLSQDMMRESVVSWIPIKVPE